MIKENKRPYVLRSALIIKNALKIIKFLIILNVYGREEKAFIERVLFRTIFLGGNFSWIRRSVIKRFHTLTNVENNEIESRISTGPALSPFVLWEV